MTIEQDELTVSPGSEVTTTVTVHNLGTRVEEFRLVPGGPAAAFASITPTALSVYPGDEQRAVARFAPARGPQSLAGVAPFEIVGRSAIHGDVSDIVRGRLTVTPFEDLTAVLTPEVSRGRRPGSHQVSVTNSGNMPVNTQLIFRDQAGELTFEPRGGGAILPPGATQYFPVLINGRRRWFGRLERLPFSAVVTPASPQPPITLNGTRCQTAVFPWWVPTAALAVVGLAIALFALLKPGTPTVPVIGPVDEATAVQMLRDAHYEPDLISLPSNDIAQGLVIKTDPEGGTELPEGEHVKLYVSAGKCQGPCPVEVPIVEGLPLNEARTKLENDKFTVRLIRAPSDRPLDEVIESNPKATTLRPPGSEVVLTVSSGPPAPSASPGPPGPPPPPPPPAQVEVPDLTAQVAANAIKALTGLGLKPKAVTVHSNAVADGQVISSQPAAASKVGPGSDVTLTVARNTAQVDLIATASQAAWKNGSGTLTFPGKEADTTGFVLPLDAAVLEDGTTATVLETSPPANSLITGVYTLAEPVIPGDHVRARVGLLKGATGQVTFVVKANGKIIQQVTDTADGKLKEFDADLSAAKGATSIEITVLAGATSTGNAAVWQDLRLEPQIG
ncbi:MAG: PASTA domain-containing protein [Pseudonocardiaceae bacterium]